ncbi:MAG: macro domain-containing protein, partial [Planctomycetes bacterium]|nr:macro domain-containing protein [Planctomycetota bacterium]
LVQIAESAWVANMVAQAGTRVTKHGPPIRYPALRECLRQLAAEAKNVNASVHMPRLGCGLAGGKWEEVARLGGRRGLRV